jgi:hypothetical protein
LDNEHVLFNTITENHHRWLVELDRRTTAAMPVDGQSVRSVRSSRSSSSRRSSWSTEARLQEKELHIKETELKVKQAQEEARIRLEEEDRIRRLDEEKRREQLKVDAERTQRQLRNELQSHQLESQILQQQLEVESSGSRPTTPMEASSLLSSKPDAAAFITPAFTTQQRAESSSSQNKGTLAKIKSFFTPARSLSFHGPAEENNKTKNTRRSLDTIWSGTSASALPSVTSSEPVVKVLPQSSTLPTSRTHVGFSVPLQPPTCEASGFSSVFKQKVSLAFTKPTEQLTTGWKFNPGGTGQAAQSTVKTSTQAAKSSFTTRLDPSVGAFVPGASDYFWKPGNSTSSTQTRSYGDLPPGGGVSARAGWGTTQTSSSTFVSSGNSFVPRVSKR